MDAVPNAGAGTGAGAGAGADERRTVTNSERRKRKRLAEVQSSIPPNDGSTCAFWVVRRRYACVHLHVPQLVPAGPSRLASRGTASNPRARAAHIAGATW